MKLLFDKFGRDVPHTFQIRGVSGEGGISIGKIDNFIDDKKIIEAYKRFLIKGRGFV